MSAFVSHDGDGTEVYVATARAKVTDIEERTSSANVKLTASYLQHPLNGWLNLNEEAYEILRKAKEDGTEVEVRIEAQRKPKIDKSIPIQEIRDSKTAKTDIIKKIACVNGVFTSEALTNPEDDPDTGKPKSALDRTAAPANNKTNGNSSAPAANKGAVLNLLNTLSTSREVSEPVIDALKAQALIAGATVQEITEASTIPVEEPNSHGASFATEAPSFKDYNSDGRLNLGGPTVASGVGVYNYVYEKLSKAQNNEPKQNVVEYFAALILSMADVIQTGAYGKGFRVDRKAGSHTRVRASLFNVIDLTSFPITNEGDIEAPEVVDGWVKHVGASARHNFITGINLSQRFPSVKTLLAFLSNDDTLEETPSTAAVTNSGSVETVELTTTPESVETPSEARPEPSEAMAEPTVEEIATTATPEPEPTPAQKETPTAEVETITLPVEETTTSNTTTEDVMFYETDKLPPGSINSSNAPSEELLTQFKEFVIEEAGLKTKEEQAKVSKLLAHTFGRAYNKAPSIPEDELADFLDFYISTGAENFRAVLDSLQN